MNPSNDGKGRTTGPFVKNGIDLWEDDKSIQWFTVIMLFLIIVGFFIYVSVAINNFMFKYTYFENPGQPGVLTSARYTFPWIVVMLSVISVGLILLFIFFMIIFRFNYGCHMIWFIMYVLSFALMIFVLVMLGSQYGDCNQPDQPDNICNDKRWCCVYFTNPANMCPNVGPCPGVTASDLSPSDEFLWLFWTLIAIGALIFIYFIVLIIYWFSPAPARKKTDEKGKEEEFGNNEEEDDEFIERRQPIERMAMSTSPQRRQTHGLRKRF